MPDLTQTESFDDADAAVARIAEIYGQSTARLRDGFARAASGESPGPVTANYPFVGFSVSHAELNTDARHSYGVLLEAGALAGRKLEFLCQEMFREINTIGSKANDVEISHRVVEAKAAVERMREIVQNIE